MSSIIDHCIYAELMRNFKGSKVRGKLCYFLQSISTLIQNKYPFDFNISTQGCDRDGKAVLFGLTIDNKYCTGANKPQRKAE